MTVAYNNGGGGNGIEVERIDASGNVVVRKGNETARGSVAIYDLNRRTITMIGNVQLTQGTNRLTGGRLIIDLRSGRSTVDGRANATGVSNERSEEHTSELQSLMRISYAVFCLKKKKKTNNITTHSHKSKHNTT